MAELNPLKLDLSRITYSGALEILSPVAPGAVLGLGTLYMNTGLAAICAIVTGSLATALTGDRKSTRLNSSHLDLSRMPSSA